MFEYILLNILWNKNKDNKETFLVSVQFLSLLERHF